MISISATRTLGLIMLLFFTGIEANSQAFEIKLLYGEKALLLNDSSLLHKGRPILITQLRFYLSGITLLQGDSTVWREADSYHLVDAAQPQSLSLNLDIPTELEYDALLFNIGVDSATSCSGAMGGDLDPTKGMFWSWNSGYINFKLEGIYAECPTRNHKFEFHLGGYQSPYSTLQRLRLKASPGKPMELIFDLSQLINRLDLAKSYRVMSPGKAALDMSIASTKICINALPE